MGINLGQFHTQVSGVFSRGTTLDTDIVNYTRQAALFLERNFDMAYMRRWVTFTISAVATTPRILALPSRIKKLHFLRIVETGADNFKNFHYLRKIDPLEAPNEEEGRPDTFWFDGVDQMILDRKVDKDYPAEMFYYQWTDWPTDLTDSHWLIDFAEDVLLAQVVDFMAPHVRDEKILTLWQKRLGQGLKTLSDSIEDFDEGPSGAENISYAGGL